MATKKKATAKQKAALAKGRKALAAMRAGKKPAKRKTAKKVRAASAKVPLYGVTHEYPRGYVHPGHERLRKRCKICAKPHTTSQHNAHAVYEGGRVLPAYALSHHHKAPKKTSAASLFKGAMKTFK